MSSLKHPRLVHLLGAVSRPFCLVMEYMELGDMWSLLKDTERDLAWYDTSPHGSTCNFHVFNSF